MTISVQAGVYFYPHMVCFSEKIQIIQMYISNEHT